MIPFPSSPVLMTWRMLLALAVVFVMLATTGWTALQRGQGTAEPLQAALASWRKGSVGNRQLPSPRSSPRRLAAFFGSLASREQTRLAERYPLVVGNLNGAPVNLRYRANRIALRREASVQDRRARDTQLSPDGRALAAKTRQQYDAMLEPGRNFLSFDPSGEGRAAEVFGDLAHARHISVVVPGVDTNVLTFQKTGKWYSAPAGMGSSLYTAERAASPASSTAVIAWADYTAPAGLGMDAAIGTLARAGAVRLTALTRSLPGAAPIALFCHSYGSVVCGVAARDLPRRVTDVAVAGSPGMRVQSARGLHTRARVWAMRDNGDWIQDIPYVDVVGLGHGADPVAPGFGARVVSAAGAQGHSGYFAPGTSSLDNFADIGVGDFRDVACAGDVSGCRSGIGAPGAV
ncbi:alpha/beta hydrolase [Streptomyces fuscigenes]|uniref:alpha/beta hydrolase n=1 Tax=Streptomyces fuscigenes TaxID=1528880 RepID=UPI001F231974|nr:alpha/beta hydrolase [Streptomyces fuscigenes]MCF3964195.1 alpha/beta hydrolase family protein [Streptomyces fuscigenes]